MAASKPSIFVETFSDSPRESFDQNFPREKLKNIRRRLQVNLRLIRDGLKNIGAEHNIQLDEKYIKWTLLNRETNVVVNDAINNNTHVAVLINQLCKLWFPGYYEAYSPFIPEDNIFREIEDLLADADYTYS